VQSAAAVVIEDVVADDRSGDAVGDVDAVLGVGRAVVVADVSLDQGGLSVTDKQALSRAVEDGVVEGSNPVAAVGVDAVVADGSAGAVDGEALEGDRADAVVAPAVAPVDGDGAVAGVRGAGSVEGDAGVGQEADAVGLSGDPQSPAVVLQVKALVGAGADDHAVPGVDHVGGLLEGLEGGGVGGPGGRVIAAAGDIPRRAQEQT